MTYSGFLLRFLVIPLVFLLVVNFQLNLRGVKLRGFRPGPAVWWAIGLHALIAVLYTTPWDNYLVATGVWYYDPDLVSGIILGWVPLEEYIFFVLQTMLTGLWWAYLAPKFSSEQEFISSKTIRLGTLTVIAVLWLVALVFLLIGDTIWTYLTITLVWALPPIMIQLVFGADILWHHRKLVLTIILVPTIYLGLADTLAISAGTWTIATDQSTGIFIGALPIEELVFFFVTNTLIGFGVTLLLADQSEKRLTSVTNFFLNLTEPLNR